MCARMIACLTGEVHGRAVTHARLGQGLHESMSALPANHAECERRVMDSSSRIAMHYTPSMRWFVIGAQARGVVHGRAEHRPGLLALIACAHAVLRIAGGVASSR